MRDILRANPDADPHVVAIELQEKASPYIAQALFVAAELGIADKLGDEPMKVDDLAAQVEADPGALYRLMRFLAANDFFVETAPRYFKRGDLAKFVQDGTPDSMRMLMHLWGIHWHWASWQYLLYSVQTGKSAFTHVFRKDFFEFIDGNPEASHIYRAASTRLADRENDEIIANVNFDGVKLIIDSGSGYGGLLSKILQTHPEIHGKLVDRPAAIKLARGVLLGKGQDERVELHEGNLREGLPPGADLYLLKRALCFHDDAAVKEILDKLKAVMKPGARLVIADLLIPEGNEPFIGKNIDLTLLVMHEGARERTEAELKALLEASGFTVKPAIQTKAWISVVEATP